MQDTIVSIYSEPILKLVKRILIKVFKLHEHTAWTPWAVIKEIPDICGASIIGRLVIQQRKCTTCGFVELSKKTYQF